MGNGEVNNERILWNNVWKRNKERKISEINFRIMKEKVNLQFNGTERRLKKSDQFLFLSISFENSSQFSKEYLQFSSFIFQIFILFIYFYFHPFDRNKSFSAQPN